MNDDPMLSPDPEVRKTYIADMIKRMNDEVKADANNRAIFRSKAYTDDGPVVVGASGFNCTLSLPQ